AKAGLQYSFILGAERLEFGRQQTHHLPLRNHHAHAIEKSGDPFASDLPGEMNLKTAIGVGRAANFCVFSTESCRVSRARGAGASATDGLEGRLGRLS